MSSGIIHTMRTRWLIHPPVRPAGQASTAPSTGFSLKNMLLTLGVIGFFWFAYSSSKEAEREASLKLQNARARERHRIGLAATVPAYRNPAPNRRRASRRSSRSYRKAA